MTLRETEEAIVKIIKETNWNETPKSPEVLVGIIEAKAELMRAHKKLKRALRAKEING